MIPMRRALGLLLFGFVCMVIQATLIRQIAGSFSVIPNLSLAMVVFIAFYEVSTAGALLAFFLGLQVDLLSGLLIGPASASFVLVYGLIASFLQRIFVESPLSVFVAVFFASLLSGIVYCGLTFTGERELGSVIGTIFIEAFLTGACAPVIFKLVRLFIYRKEGTPAYR